MTRCKVGALLDGTTLEPADRTLLEGWLTNGLDARGRRVSGDDMAMALATEGHPVGPTTVKAHRRGACACYRERTPR